MRATAALALTALALGGCASSPSDEDQVREVISDYVQAVGGDDPERVCELIVQADGRRPPSSCRDRVRRGRLQALGDVRVGAVGVRGERATARVDGERVDLRRVDGAWRIVAPG